MRRRDFAALLALGLAAPRALAQAKPGARRIGFLIQGNPDPGTSVPERQRQGSQTLRKYGWIEGENLIIERAFAYGQLDRAPALIEEMLRKGVELVVTDGPETTLAAARATTVVPIVFVGVVWPVEQGLIESFARPGKNLTGISFYTGVEVSNKRLEFLREVAPSARRLAWLWPGEFAEKIAGGMVDMASAMGNAAKSLGFETRFFDIRKAGDIDVALAETLRWRAQAMQISGGMGTPEERQRIADFVLHHRIPAATPSLSMVQQGALLFYGPSPSEWPQLVPRFFGMVDRILRGAKPAEIPVERPANYDLVLNLKTARAIGVKVPPSILLRAERVIE